jgi:hypothetical protein
VWPALYITTMGVFSRRLLLNLLRRLTHTNRQSFTRFLELPAELGILIWGLALEPRVVRLVVKYTPRIFGYHLVAVTHKSPSHLRVNREARSIALKYHLSLFIPISNPSAIIYFNYAQDTLQGDIWEFKEWMYEMPRHVDDMKGSSISSYQFAVIYGTKGMMCGKQHRLSKFCLRLLDWRQSSFRLYLLVSCPFLTRNISTPVYGFTSYKIEWIKELVLDDIR